MLAMGKTATVSWEGETPSAIKAHMAVKPSARDCPNMVQKVRNSHDRAIPPLSSIVRKTCFFLMSAKILKKPRRIAFFTQGILCAFSPLFSLFLHSWAATLSPLAEERTSVERETLERPRCTSGPSQEKRGA